MLQAIRDRVTGIVAIFILGLLAVPFVFFGLDSYVRDVPQDAVAKVGDDKISVSQFQSEFARYRAQLRAQQGDAYDDLQTNRPEARREFLESMIDRRLLAQYAGDMGLAISPKTIADVIRDVPAFQVNGRFDPDVYRQRIQANGQTVGAFERDLARDLLVQQLPGAVQGSTIVTQEDVDRWLRLQMETRAIAVVEVALAPFRDQVEVDEAEIESFYEANRSQFMRPARVSVEYIELDTSDMAESLEIDEEELRERYEATKGRFMTAERRRASHILITSGDERSEEEAQALAESLKERIDQGEAFDALAEEYSDDPGSAAQGGDLGWIEPDVMMPAFEEALYALEAGEVSEPVQTEFGWHLIKLTEIDEPRGQTFEEARDEIAAEIREERAEDMYVEMSDRLIDLVYADPTGLKAIAEDMGLELETAGPFSRFTAEGVLAEPQVLEAIFSDMVLLERQASEPIEIERNHAVVVRAIDHQPAEPRPLEDVRGEIRDRLVAEAAREAAREYAEALVERARTEDAGLAGIAEAEELELREQEVTRRSFDYPPQIIQEIFALPHPSDQGGPVFDIVQIPSGWLLVRLDEVVPGDPSEADDARRRSARQQIAFQRAALEFQGLLQWLRENTEVSVVADRL
ncbi:MAG: SurA N-terminal domain-containing protein [Wenzhouxiangellaceae bacterium]|nr:SurA N-terminal domain-containing protein [Wenzhouxiangellaceae bacterium]